MNDRQKRFIKLLENIFELDKSDLDFGIYRVMNIRRTEIEKFFKEGLPKKINETLAPFASADSATIRKRMEEIESQLGGIEIITQMPAAVPMVAEYNDLKKKLADGVDISALESDIYSALYSFFSRYYDDGDFISKRRYKEGVYAIPYEGEEVKLYWANHDQYYIKTSENFKDYTFVTNEIDGITVHFRLVDATTEQNNNKETDDKKRTFMLYAENSENPDLKTFEYNTETRELIIRFTYDIPADKRIKWHEVNMKAINAWIAQEHTELIGELLRNVSTKTSEHMSLIEKHLKGYVAKNTFDYFIHKDLGGFLRRELDFFIKNEVMHIDDIDTDTETRVEAYLGKVRAIKRVGAVIIDFLAQVEDFQKRLWLKKKFVVETNYCITLDKIDESFFEEIAANEAQVKEWIEMYTIDEVEGFTTTPTIEFLHSNQNLIIDTRHFDASFRDKLIASIDNLDDKIDGYLLASENYQGLNLLREKFANRIALQYIDPPFNLNTNARYPYSTDYKDSTWLTLLANRHDVSQFLMREDGVYFVRCDYHGNHFVRMVLDRTGLDYKSEILLKRSRNEAGSTKMDVTHEYLFMYGKPNIDIEKYKINRSVADIKWTGFLMAGDRNPPQRTFMGKTIFPPKGQHFSLVQQKVDKLLSEYHLRLKCKKCGRLFYNAPSTEELSKAMKNKSHKFKFYDITTSTNFSGVQHIDKCLECDCDEFIVQYLGAPDEFVNDNWMDISSYSKNWSFLTENSEECLERVILFSKPNDWILDYFVGSGTTIATAKKMGRKWVGIDMAEYINDVTLNRMKKVYSGTDKSGINYINNVARGGIFKYICLESYEDALSNIELKKTSGISLFGEDYLINYMLKMESRDSLLSIDKFRSPFEYKMRITEKNECRERSVDLCETFNYLIGLKVMSQGTISYFSAERSKTPAYDGAVDLRKDDGGAYGFRQIEGVLPDGHKALVIWRTITDDILASNAALDAYFSKYHINPAEREYDIIYVNGDNNLENLRTDDEQWKVVIIEKEFNEKMWEE